MSKWKKIAVVGAGTMGQGIAQLAAMSGFEVTVLELDQKRLEKAQVITQKSCQKLAEKEKLKEPWEKVLERFSWSSKLEDLASCDLVIEAITERFEAKAALFKSLDAILAPEAVLATNTSSLSVMELANASGRPENFVGLHFFNPVVLMQLVEVIRTPLVRTEVFQKSWDFALALGKTPLEARDTPGFLFNRLILPYLNESVWALFEGVGTIDSLDQAMLLGGNMPIGPLALLDLIGLDVALHAMEAFLKESGDTKYRICPLLKMMVRAGYLGRKTSLGFYDYRGEETKPVSLEPFLAQN